MKTLFFLLVFFSSLTAQALTRPQLEELLKEKGIELTQLEIQGMRVFMGEVSGHITALPFSKVQVIVTEDEAILKSEIESVEFSSDKSLGSVRAIRYSGRYILRSDVKATVALK